MGELVGNASFIFEQRTRPGGTVREFNDLLRDQLAPRVQVQNLGTLVQQGRAGNARAMALVGARASAHKTDPALCGRGPDQLAQAESECGVVEEWVQFDRRWVGSAEDVGLLILCRRSSVRVLRRSSWTDLIWAGC
jgi:hypothetical protein